MSSHLDYGLVSNGQISALVGPRAEIDWLCMPTLDSPSVFAALVDRNKGGRLAIETYDANARWSQRYEDETNVLISRCELAGGAFEIIDAAVVAPRGPVSELVRLLRPIAGTPRVRIVFDPRLDYARWAPSLSFASGVVSAGELSLAGSRSIEDIAHGGDVVIDEPIALVLSWRRAVTEPTVAAVTTAIDAAVAADRAFVAGLNHRGDRRQIRSALVLRAHTAPSGAIAAATTTSVPEAIGSPRTWDYRYAWIRDGCFAANALVHLGDLKTASRLLDFFAGVCADGVPQPLYGLDGRAELPESELDHLSGFADTKPVRIGNAAAKQRQHDSMGQLIWLAFALEELGEVCSGGRLAWIGRLADRASRVADTPDSGIWEFRHRPRLYTYSQTWIWVALDRASRLFSASDRGRSAAFAEQASATRDRILAAAKRAGFFAQTIDGKDDADASSLQIASLGLVAPGDPLFRKTIERVESRLSVGPLLARYVIEDDFGDTTSAFSLCQLWRIAAHRQIGETARADELLEHFGTLANPLGLFAEDIDPQTYRQLGNFPQVYTHTGLIEAIATD